MYSRKARSHPHSGAFREPTVRFAIVGNPRCGSSHLVSLLDSHPAVACWDDEIFDEGQLFEKSEYRDPVDFLEGCVFAVNSVAVGFKLLWDALNRLDKGWVLLHDMDIRIVHTYRANVLDSFISYRLATINNAFTNWYGDFKTLQFDAEFRECLEWFKQTEDRDTEIQRRAFEHGIPRLSIEYNELCRSQDTVLDFLGVSRAVLVSRLKKQRTGAQSQIINNYKELKEYFKGSPWSKYFED
jgi:LPS sulfotransferase NodH